MLSLELSYPGRCRFLGKAFRVPNRKQHLFCAVPCRVVQVKKHSAHPIVRGFVGADQHNRRQQVFREFGGHQDRGCYALEQFLCVRQSVGNVPIGMNADFWQGGAAVLGLGGGFFGCGLGGHVLGLGLRLGLHGFEDGFGHQDALAFLVLPVPCKPFRLDEFTPGHSFLLLEKCCIAVATLLR